MNTTHDSRPRRRTNRWLVTAVFAIVATISLPISVAGAATTPAKWAKAVCGATSTWVEEVAEIADLTAATVPTSAASVKKTLGKLLSKTIKSTASARKKLAKAGVPKVPDGKQIAATVKEGFRQVNRTLGQARKSLARTSTRDPERFTTTVRGIQDALESGLESIQAALSAARDADAEPLVAAFDRTRSCGSITG